MICTGEWHTCLTRPPRPPQRCKIRIQPASVSQPSVNSAQSTACPLCVPSTAMSTRGRRSSQQRALSGGKVLKPTLRKQVAPKAKRAQTAEARCARITALSQLRPCLPSLGASPLIGQWYIPGPCSQAWMECAVQKTCKRWACCTRLVGVRHSAPYRKHLRRE